MRPPKMDCIASGHIPTSPGEKVVHCGREEGAAHPNWYISGADDWHISGEYR
jgi:hypothetical protein